MSLAPLDLETCEPSGLPDASLTYTGEAQRDNPSSLSYSQRQEAGGTRQLLVHSNSETQPDLLPWLVLGYGPNPLFSVSLGSALLTFDSVLCPWLILF